MTAAIPLYERLGYRRAPEFDLDMNTHYGSTAAKPWTAIAYLRCLPTQPDPPAAQEPSTTPNGEYHMTTTMPRSDIPRRAHPKPLTAAPSYSRGQSDIPLLDETIGANFDRTAASHGDREALVEYATGRRWTYASSSPMSTRSRTDCCGSESRRATGSASGHRTARSGPSCNTPPPRSAPSWSASTRPTEPMSWSTCSIRPASACWSRPESFKTSDYAAMIAEVRPNCPDARARRPDRQRTMAGAARPRTATRPCWPATQAALAPHDPINIQYTSGTTGHPKGATLSPPQHPQQRLPPRRGCAATPSTTGSASRSRCSTSSAW